jgi:hypothetical protein
MGRKYVGIIHSNPLPIQIKLAFALWLFRFAISLNQFALDKTFQAPLLFVFQ